MGMTMAHHTSRLATIAVAFAVLGALAGCSNGTTTPSQSTDNPVVEAADFSIVGTWTGHRERIASTEGYRNGDATLIVDAQEGLTFTGEIVFTTPEGDQTQPLVGAMTPGGTTMMGADEEGTYVFTVVDDNTLDYCYSEHGEGYRTTCARLTRE
jgi:hypothetical protein